MTKEDLIKANELKKKIDELDWFISNAESVWTGKLEMRLRPKMFFKTNAYGCVNGKELELDTETKNEVLEFIKNKRDKYISELTKL